MHQPGVPHQGGLFRGQTGDLRGRGSEVGDSAGVAEVPRRLQIRVVGEYLQGGAKLTLGNAPVESCVVVDQHRPRIDGIEVAEDLVGFVDADINQVWVELRAASASQHVQSHGDPIAGDEHLCVVCDLHDPHHGFDLGAADRAGHTLAIPPLERVRQCTLHLLEPQPVSDIAGGLAVRDKPVHGIPVPAGEKSPDRGQAAQRGRLGRECETISRISGSPTLSTS